MHLSAPIKRFQLTIKPVCLLICLILLVACGGGGDNSSSIDTEGSLSFKLQFVDPSEPQNLQISSAVDICEAHKIKEIRAYISRLDGTVLASETWPCADHGGVLDDIAPTTDLVLSVEGMVEGVNEPMWKGQLTGIEIIAGQITPVGTVLVINVQNDDTPPQITSATPKDGATNVAINTAFLVNFDESVSAVSLQNAFMLTDGESTAVEGVVSYFGNDTDQVWQAKFTPNDNLAAETEYTMTLLDVVVDLAGNAIDEKTWRFNTGTETIPAMIWGQHNWGEANWQ